MVITFCFCLGDVAEILNTPTGYPYMEVFLNSTKSTGAATFMSVIILWSIMMGNLTIVATASRQLYA